MEISSKIPEVSVTQSTKRGDGGSAARSTAAANVAEVKVALPERASIKVPDFEPKDIQKAIDDLQDYVTKLGRNLNVRMDGATDRPVITVRDANTQELVRQIPTEEVMAIAAKLESTLAEWKSGFFFDNQI
jgi:flagellar protein FlaG